jgi:hypothetical protein
MPQRAGEYGVNLGAVRLTDIRDRNYVQYCDLTLKALVAEGYYLKFFPASFLRRSGRGSNEHYDLRIDIYSVREEMIRNGWRHFETAEEMNAAIDVDNLAPNMRDITLRTEYTWKDPE